MVKGEACISSFHKEKDVNVRITAKQSKLSRFDVKNVPKVTVMKSLPYPPMSHILSCRCQWRPVQKCRASLALCQGGGVSSIVKVHPQQCLSRIVPPVDYEVKMYTCQ